MAFDSWRGTVGIIKPTLRPGSMEELIRILPEGIGLVITHIDIRTGTRSEFEKQIPYYEARVEELAEADVDVIHPAGAPPFFLLGYEGEQELIKRWEEQYKNRFLRMERVRLTRCALSGQKVLSA